MVAELGRLPWLERIDLSRFDEAELVQQLTGILGRVPDAAMARMTFSSAPMGMPSSLRSLSRLGPSAAGRFPCRSAKSWPPALRRSTR